MNNSEQPVNSKSQSVFWSTSVAQQLQQQNTTDHGLSAEEANQRIKRYGANQLNNKKAAGNIQLFLLSLKAPLFLILLFATGLSFFCMIVLMPPSF